MRILCDSVAWLRGGNGPALVRVTVPRLCGHSGQDTQAYKGQELLAEERARDPLTRLRRYLIPGLFSESQWMDLEREVEDEIQDALESALARPDPDRLGDSPLCFRGECG